MSPSPEGTRMVPTVEQLSADTTPASLTRQICPGQCPGLSMTSQRTPPLGPSRMNELPSLSTRSVSQGAIDARVS